MTDGSQDTPANAAPPALRGEPLQTWREDGHGRRAAPDAVWAAVRDDYLAGLSAPEAAERHGVGLRSLRSRAAREGWRRCDQPWTPRNRLDPDDEGVELESRVGGDLDKVEPGELSWVATRRMMRAVMRGDAADALRWGRVRDLMDAEEAELERLGEQQDAIRDRRLAILAAVAAREDEVEDAADAHPVHPVHASHGVFSAGD